MLTKIFIHLFSILGVAGISFSTLLLHPLYIGIVNAYGLIFFMILGVVAVVFIYKYPNISLKLFIVSLIGHIAIILSYVILETGDVHWRQFDFLLTILRISYICLSVSIYLLWKNKK